MALSSPTKLFWVAPEVAYSDGSFLSVGPQTIVLLKDAAAQSPRRRCRLCFHADPQAAQQEMLIVMQRESYVRPHRHNGKVETLLVVEGAADALLFDANGALAARIGMSAPGDGGHFFYRMPPGLFHTLVFRSDWLVFVETTIGPFDPAMSESAPWAPAESDPQAGRAFLAGLEGVAPRRLT